MQARQSAPAGRRPGPGGRTFMGMEGGILVSVPRHGRRQPIDLGDAFGTSDPTMSRACKDGMMTDAALVTCPGTVTVHRDEAVTCSHDDCPRDMNRGRWFGMHARFVHCAEARDPVSRCPDCSFEAHVPATTSRRHHPLRSGQGRQ